MESHVCFWLNTYISYLYIVFQLFFMYYFCAIIYVLFLNRYFYIIFEPLFVAFIFVAVCL